MSVTVDHELVQTEELGVRTVGQLLTHVQRDNRLVVNLLIDGAQPNLDLIREVRRAPLAGHTIFIETAEPRRVALDALREVDDQLSEADRLKGDAVELIQASAVEKGMEKLSGCFGTWQNAQESIQKTAQLLRIDLDAVRVEDRTLREMLKEFTEQLRGIKVALEARDFVSLCDILTYEMTQATNRWRAALEMLREIIL